MHLLSIENPNVVDDVRIKLVRHGNTILQLVRRLYVSRESYALHARCNFDSTQSDFFEFRFQRRGIGYDYNFEIDLFSFALPELQVTDAGLQSPDEHIARITEFYEAAHS